METQYSFSIKGIEIVNSSLIAPQEGGKPAQFTFEAKFRAVGNTKDNVVTIFSDVVITDPEKKAKIGHYSVMFHYGVKELETLMVKRNSLEAKLPEQILKPLLGISVSTLRGMMFSDFRGTFLHNAILPVIDLSEVKPMESVST